jgi:hypothetical protein
VPALCISSYNVVFPFPLSNKYIAYQDDVQTCVASKLRGRQVQI